MGLWEVEVLNLTNGATFIDRGEIFINNGGLLKYDLTTPESFPRPPKMGLD